MRPADLHVGRLRRERVKAAEALKGLKRRAENAAWRRHGRRGWGFLLFGGFGFKEVQDHLIIIWTAEIAKANPLLP